MGGVRSAQGSFPDEGRPGDGEGGQSDRFRPDRSCQAQRGCYDGVLEIVVRDGQAAGEVKPRPL